MQDAAQTASSISSTPRRSIVSAATRRTPPASSSGMAFAEVTIVTLAEGEISELHVGLKGTMNALFLKDLAQKTRRGLRVAFCKAYLVAVSVTDTTSFQERREFAA